MSFIFIASPRIVSGCCVVRGNRLHGLDLSTKHVADDSREPENEKASIWRPCLNINSQRW
ncbi:hypothetical protein CGN00_00770 [Salmonella enterica]|uniref:Uncharacterized protein n=2 Tax=Salmonella enterica TaxID=28901 RepID=A0A618W5H3_SALNE|nr:hypothetical protein [Salmonella enterica]EAA8484279.1 hypothetical protein [Salmonella enterica subsp. enterica serovar Newport]ECH9068998.1 hypothetical protein [Salmonella enterica subsp. enterica]EDP9433273.1 hypothetical protein [Salmonella enterica subsp. diarizonae]EDQ1018132.1 hypothetical protein [Salmonella enterica subsp. houtenae serovar 50:z4,z23:-]EDQ2286690.1 hypothetical protein [Salmonella enterica subsp. arizonae]EDV3253443.1 hypothetical protein [Salmonella enterica subs